MTCLVCGAEIQCTVVREEWYTLTGDTLTHYDGEVREVRIYCKNDHSGPACLSLADRNRIADMAHESN